MGLGSTCAPLASELNAFVPSYSSSTEVTDAPLPPSAHGDTCSQMFGGQVPQMCGTSSSQSRSRSVSDLSPAEGAAEAVTSGDEIFVPSAGISDEVNITGRGEFVGMGSIRAPFASELNAFVPSIASWSSSRNRNHPPRGSVPALLVEPVNNQSARS